MRSDSADRPTVIGSPPKRKNIIIVIIIVKTIIIHRTILTMKIKIINIVTCKVRVAVIINLFYRCCFNYEINCYSNRVEQDRRADH